MEFPRNPEIYRERVADSRHPLSVRQRLAERDAAAWRESILLIVRS